jgi:glucosyl-dolichyl phosphate glucuronosyltransferase
MNVSSATILLCTYNRSRMLGDTLASLVALDAPADCSWEIVVVDNNSTDDTAAVVAQYAAMSRVPVVYAKEPAQGKSFALNHGLALASGDIIALTDDDVLASKDWLSRLVETFREHSVTFAFGKVLPRWERVPPPELLTQRAQCIWGPLAIVDYGDEAAPYSVECNGRLPIGANLAFARDALVAIGGWRTDLGKVNNTLISGEDHEIFTRLKRQGLYVGYYDPAIVVKHFVPSSRLTRRYFRKWFFWHGKTEARMLDTLFPELDMDRVPRVAGAPRFLYRQAFWQFVRWFHLFASDDALSLLTEELRTFQVAGLFAESWRRYFSGTLRRATGRAAS